MMFILYVVVLAGIAGSSLTEAGIRTNVDISESVHLFQKNLETIVNHARESAVLFANENKNGQAMSAVSKGIRQISSIIDAMKLLTGKIEGLNDKVSSKVEILRKALAELGLDTTEALSRKNGDNKDRIEKAFETFRTHLTSVFTEHPQPAVAL